MRAQQTEVSAATPEAPRAAGIARSTILMLTASAVGSLFGLFRGFYVARTMAPADFGVWSLVAVMLNYANYADVGINTGFILEVPRLLGQGKPTDAMRVQRQTYTATLFVTIVLAALVMAGSFAMPPGIRSFAVSLRIIALSIVVSALVNYHQVVARISEHWGAIALAAATTSIVAAAGVVLSSTLSGHLSVEAAAFSSVLGSIAAAVILGYAGWSTPSWPLNWSTARRLILIGFPISLLPILFTIFQSIDRWIVAGTVSRTLLGYYGLGTTIGLFLYLVPNTLATVLFTRQITRFGETGDPRMSSSMVLPPIHLSAYIMALIAGGLVLAMPYIIHYLTPSYAPALGIASLQAIGNCLLFVIPTGGNFLISVQKQRPLAAVLVGALAFEMLAVGGLVRTRWGIYGAAWGVVASDVLYSVAVASVCLGLFGVGRRRQLSLIALYFLPFALCLPVALLLRPLSHPTGIIYTDGIRLFSIGTVYSTVAVGFCLMAARVSGLLSEPIIATRIKAWLPSQAKALLRQE